MFAVNFFTNTSMCKIIQIFAKLYPIRLEPDRPGALLPEKKQLAIFQSTINVTTKLLRLVILSYFLCVVVIIVVKIVVVVVVVLCVNCHLVFILSQTIIH